MGEKVKWGVLGTAGIARGCTIPGMQLADNCELYAIAGRSLEKAQKYAEEFGFEKAYGDYESLLADENVCAVYIPLPNQLHYEWVMKAIEAGKHILCEKPITPTMQQAKELFDAAKAKGVILMEAFAYLHTPYIAALKEELEKGTIGRVTYIESAFLTQWYDPSNIRTQKECYGGATYDLGCYCTSMILTLLGKAPVSVKAVADYSDGGVDVLTAGIMNFGDELRASFNCGMNFDKAKDSRMDRLFINGTKGYIKSDVEFNQAGDLSYTVCTKEGTVEKTVSVKQNYSLEVEQLGRCILDGEKQHVTPEFSVMNAGVIDKIIECIEY